MLLLLLAEAIPVSDPLERALQYGLLSIIVVMFLTGWLWPKPAVDDIKKTHALDREEWAKQNQAILNELQQIKELLRSQRG